MYDVASMKAEEFISHEEILDTLAWAEANKDNKALCLEYVEKARKLKGLTHREAALLLLNEDQEVTDRIFEVAGEIKEAFYGNRIVLMAPLYLSNYCVNGCVYCPYHKKNKNIVRKKLTQEELKNEVIALQDMGHKRLVLEAGEDPENNPIEYILECIKTIYSIKHKNGAIRRVNINIAATSVENYRKLKEAEVGTYTLFQETYNKEQYQKLHPSGPKSDYVYHTEAMDRAMEGGLDDVGLGVLFGLNLYKYDFVGLLMHAEHLEAAFGVGPHTISVPRLKDADDVDSSKFKNGISDELFVKITALIRIVVPYTGIIISSRESEETRAKLLPVGISQMSGGSRTTVGGYTQAREAAENSAQFEISDGRELDEVVEWLLDEGHIPSFCTACYRAGRQGDRFMPLVKAGEIKNCCLPNALITLKEYLEDYANDRVREKGVHMIEEQIPNIKSDQVREAVRGHLKDIEDGKRDFRF